MKRWILVSVIPLFLPACGDVEDTKEYQAGYEAGHYDGYRVGFLKGKEEGEEEGRAEICDQIERRLNNGAADEVGC